MELPNKQCRSSLQRCVDTRLTVGTAWRVPRVDNTEDDRQTSVAGQARTKTHRLRSLLVIYVLPPLGDIQYYSNPQTG